MEDYSKLDLENLEENNVMGTQKISVLDHVNGFQYSTTDKSDDFVIDMESFSNGSNKNINNANSRITLKRSLSRKGIHRGNEKKMSSINPTDNREIHSSDLAASSSRGSSASEKATAVTQGTSNQSSNLPVHHQITITTGNVCTKTENRCPTRRNSFRRSTSPWCLTPRRVLFLFATVSSMGSMLMIYFTLSMGKLSGIENNQA